MMQPLSERQTAGRLRHVAVPSLSNPKKTFQGHQINRTKNPEPTASSTCALHDLGQEASLGGVLFILSLK